MQNDQFLVVEFDQGGVAIIPDLWADVTSKSAKCFWPGDKSATTLAKKRTKPCDSWESYTMTIISSSDTFDGALRKMKKSLQDSDAFSSSNENKLTRAKRKRRKTEVAYSHIALQESDSEELTTLPQFQMESPLPVLNAVVNGGSLTDISGSSPTNIQGYLKKKGTGPEVNSTPKSLRVNENSSRKKQKAADIEKKSCSVSSSTFLSERGLNNADQDENNSTECTASLMSRKNPNKTPQSNSKLIDVRSETSIQNYQNSTTIPIDDQLSSLSKNLGCTSSSSKICNTSKQKGQPSKESVVRSPLPDPYMEHSQNQFEDCNQESPSDDADKISNTPRNKNKFVLPKAFSPILMEDTDNEIVSGEESNHAKSLQNSDISQDSITFSFGPRNMENNETVISNADKSIACHSSSVNRADENIDLLTIIDQNGKRPKSILEQNRSNSEGRTFSFGPRNNTIKNKTCTSSLDQRKTCFSNSVNHAAEKTKALPATIGQNMQKQILKQNPNKSWDPRENGANSTPQQNSAKPEWYRDIVRNQEIIKATQKNLVEMVQIILQGMQHGVNNRQQRTGATSHENGEDANELCSFEEHDYGFPLIQIEKLTIMETKLDDKEERIKLCEYLCQFGGLTLKDVTNRILHHVFSKTLGSKYSWEGRKAAVKKSKYAVGATNCDVEKLIKDWSRHCPAGSKKENFND